ncbi:MAG: SpoIIE family protein phosphatase [Cyanobacteria bacterium Co-bin13]|nr:SpoIIE family protein phosphatase [Cyanobacteria bacterium Co-bin13]
MTDILVIEHDPITEHFLVHTLRQQGYTVTTAHTGQEGLTQAKTLQPAVIICDWNIPGTVDGLTICQTVKQSIDLSTTFFLLLTSRHSIADRVKGLELGADDLLSTPVDVNELRARVRAGLRLHQLARDLRQQKQRLEDELAEAEAYVRSLLPHSQGGRVPIHARFVPSQQLGGDCYDYYWLDPDYLVMYLLDVSGHGLGSALLSTSVLNVLRSQSLPDVNFYRPEKVLKALNETFQMSDQNQKYFTIWYGVLNCANRQLLYASAGHPPAILISEQPQGFSAERLRTPGMPIGMMPEARYQWQRCQVPPNSTLYLFSDGLYEVLQDNREYIGLDGFIDFLSQGQRQKHVDDILQSVEQRRSANSATDDMSLVAITLD